MQTLADELATRRFLFFCWQCPVPSDLISTRASEDCHSSTKNGFAATLAFSQTTHLVSVHHVSGWYVALLLVYCIFFLCISSLVCPGYDLVYTLRFSGTISLFMRGLLWAHVWQTWPWTLALSCQWQCPFVFISSSCCKAHWKYYSRYLYHQRPSPILAYLLPLCLVSTLSICALLLVSLYILVRVPTRILQSLWGNSSGRFAGLWATFSTNVFVEEPSRIH